ncbi:ImmA/IrrE family metallo-endopeptidase [Nocardioides zeicaulis]|uniref:ImmA/IrrE family metallo-endopeptidase n=1 Tax=Nocardioides zeicaulis TaxID=1776857 RepID=A0ABV6E1G6_9ACTN
MADTLVEEYDLAPPVDVQALVENLAEVRDISIDTEVGLDAVLYGLNSRGGDDRPVLLLNNNVPDTRRRFTLGHELGHLQMAWHVGTMSCNVDYPFDESEDSAVWASASSYELERDADQFASRILIPSRFVAGLDPSDPEAMLAAVAQAQVSADASIIGLASLLGPGHVFVILDPFTRSVSRVASSPDTFNLGIYRGRPFDRDQVIKAMTSHGETRLQGARVFWGVVQDSMDLVTDDDNWEELLLGLLTRHFPGETQNGGVWQSANGVASAAHSSFGHEDVPQLAVRIRQRFLKRADFVEMVEDPMFDAFASARANAFARRPSKRRKR